MVAQSGGVDARDMCGVSGIDQFTDVASDDYGAAYILCMRALGLSVGTGGREFSPHRVVSREQMASFLVRLWRDVLDRPCPEGGTPFRDVTGTTHANDIACIYNLGITKGTSQTTYGPLDELTASQIARFLLRTYEKAGMSCPSHDSELDEAVECLHSLRVIPSIEQGKSSLPVARSQMAVYVIGLWHNLAGRGLPPEPPGPFIDLVLPVPEESANLANVVTTGRIELPVYICAREARYRIAHLRSATDRLNQRVASFYREQSSGEVDLRFVTGGIVSPDLDWDGITLYTLWTHPDDRDPCSAAAIEQEGHSQLVMLVDVRPSVVGGFARLGVGPAVQPMAHHFWSEVPYLDVVAHEIGHSRFAFYHPHQRVGFTSPLGEYHNERVYDPDDDSLMSYRGTNNLDTTHIACAQRAQAGWPSGPTLPNGQQCPGGGPGQDDSVPNPPRILSVATGDRQVTVRWEPPRSDRGWVWLTGYTVSVDDGRGPPDTRTVSDNRAIITGLTNGVTYTIRVTADNSVGSSQPAVVTATPGATTTVPGAPINVRVVEGDGELDVRWSPPSDDGGLPITEYNLWYTVGSAAIGVTLGPSELSFRIRGRPNGVPVTVWVRARNDNGEGPPSTRVTATPKAGTTVPGSPVNVRVDEGDGELVVRWSPPSDDGGSPITGYVVTFAVGGRESSLLVGSGVSSYRLGPLQNGVPVTVWVRARNDDGEGPPSTRVTATPKAGTTVPGSPVNVRVDEGDGELVVRWSPPSDDGGSPITGYVVTFAVGGRESSLLVGSGVSSYRLGPLQNGVPVTVWVRARNDDGEGPPSTRVTATPKAGTTVPGSPVNVRVDEGDGELVVRWSPPSDDGGSPITGYVVTFAVGGRESSLLVGSGVSSYRLGPLQNGVPVTVWVRARSANGEGPPSVGVTGTPRGVAIPPEAPDVRAVSRGNRIEASWSAVDNGSPIDRWELGGVGAVAAAITSYTWTDQPPGDHTVRVRARNGAGWGPWGSTTVTVVTNPTVTTTRGDPGPTGGPEVNDAPCAANDSSCRWLNVTVEGFSPGSYTGRCIHEGFRWSNGAISAGGWWREFTIDVGADGKATITKPCYITFSALLGAGAHVSINLNGQWIDSNILAPDTHFVLLNRGGPGPTTAPRPGSIPCAVGAHDCRWLDIQLRNFPQGTYRVYCAHDGFNNHPAGYWHSFETTISANGGTTISNHCYISIPSTRGRGVIIYVGEASSPIGQYQWTSNWLR